jgi:hypothetical protein
VLCWFYPLCPALYMQMHLMACVFAGVLPVVRLQ